MLSLETFNFLLAIGTLAMQVASVILVGVFVLRKRVSLCSEIVTRIGKWGLWTAFLLALSAALINQYYNEGLGIPPCDLCWWGRIFLYPQIILFGMALWRERYTSAMVDFSITLSIIGGGISLYHHALQLFPNVLPCPATGISCAQRFLFELGYITYPLMAATLFAFLIILMLFVKRRSS